MDFFTLMKNKIKHIFIGLRNLAYTRALRKYGERTALAVYRFDLFTYFLSPLIILLCFSALLKYELGYGYEYSSENEKAKWVLIFPVILLIVSTGLFRIIYRSLVPKTEPLRQLEGEEFKRLTRLVLTLVFGPLAILFIVFALVAK